MLKPKTLEWSSGQPEENKVNLQVQWIELRAKLGDKAWIKAFPRHGENEVCPKHLLRMALALSGTSLVFIICHDLCGVQCIQLASWLVRVTRKLWWKDCDHCDCSELSRGPGEGGVSNNRQPSTKLRKEEALKVSRMDLFYTILLTKGHSNLNQHHRVYFL